MIFFLFVYFRNRAHKISIFHSTEHTLRRDPKAIAVAQHVSLFVSCLLRKAMLDLRAYSDVTAHRNHKRHSLTFALLNVCLNITWNVYTVFELFSICSRCLFMLSMNLFRGILLQLLHIFLSSKQPWECSTFAWFACVFRQRVLLCFSFAKAAWCDFVTIHPHYIHWSAACSTSWGSHDLKTKQNKNNEVGAENDRVVDWIPTTQKITRTYVHKWWNFYPRSPFLYIIRTHLHFIKTINGSTRFDTFCFETAFSDSGL